MQRITLMYVKVTPSNISVSILSSLLDIQHQRDSAIASTVCSIDRQAGGSLTRNPKRPFAVPWRMQENVLF